MVTQAMQLDSLPRQDVPQIWRHRPPALALNPEIADKLLERIASGRSLVDVCGDEDMPTTAAVRAWLADPRYADFLAAYVHAREEQADSLFDDMLEIADDSRNDWMERRDKKTGEIEIVPNLEHINRTRLRVDTRKWIVSKLLPKKYGDLVRTEHSGKVDVGVTDHSERLQELARVMRQDKRLAPPIEGEVIRKEAKPKPIGDSRVTRVEDAPEDISDLI